MLASAALVALSLPVLAWTGYLAWLALLSMGGRFATAASSEGALTVFDLIVPAHNEEAGIAETVASLIAMDYPAPHRRIVVVADNCTDATAARAAQAGAVVLERNDLDRKGKGYALARAFEHSFGSGASAVVVVDADTRVSKNLLRAFDARLRAGARAVQAHYAVANRHDSWRTRLMHIAFTLFHDVRSRGRERMRVSAGLRGNGMAFAVETLREVPHDAFSVVEDVEYGIRLGFAGHRVVYAGDAQVFGDMVSSEKASRSQRRRWEGGRWALARAHAPRLVIEGLRRHDPMLLDLAADLLVPPLTYVVLTSMGGTLACLTAVLAHAAQPWVLAPWGVCLFLLAVYLVRGIWLSGAGIRAVLDLSWAPFYMMWKVGLALFGTKPKKEEWVRTARERKGQL